MDGGMREREQAAHFRPVTDVSRTVKSNRDRLFALWVAAQMGMSGASAEIYAAEVTSYDLNHPGDLPMLGMVLSHLRAARVSVTGCELLSRLSHAEIQARDLILGQKH